jgi:hypothetical protein
VLFCLVGLVTSLIPAIAYRDPFWGVTSFADKQPFEAGNLPGAVILSIEAGSPAALAELKAGDRIAKVNGKEVDFATFREVLSDLQTGQPITLDGWRNQEELHLQFTGEPRSLEGLLFLDWQFVAAPVLLVLLLIMIATQPLDSPLWRAILVMLCGLIVVASMIVVETTQKARPWTAVWQLQSISNGHSPVLHYTLAALALLTGLALSFLGAFSIRATLIRRTAPPNRATSS